MASRSAALLLSLLVACSRRDAPEAGTSPAGAPVVAAAPRNIVLLTLDTLCADELGCYGNAHGLTPKLDALAARGTRFERACAQMPETGPSHAAMLSGRYPLSHGVTNNSVALSPEVETLGNLLLHSGFVTGAFVNIFPFDKNHIADGFQRLTRDMGRPAEFLARELSSWLDERPPDKRFFAWIHCYIAHTPYDAPKRYVDRWVAHPYTGPLDIDAVTRMRMRTGELAAPVDYVRAFRERYDAQVALLDERVGDLVRVLEQRHLLDTTLLIVVGDHGESFDAKSLGLHSYELTQATLRVPLIVLGPGVAPRATIPDVVELIDLCPTILETAGVPPPPLVQGRSLWPLLRAGAAAAGDDAATNEWEGRAFASLPTFHGEGSDHLPESFVCWRQPWKLVMTGTGDDARVRLFDLEHDPEEQRDVAAERTEVVRALRRALDDWIERTQRERARPGEPVTGLDEVIRALGYGR